MTEVYYLHNYLQIPQINRLNAEQQFDIRVVGTVLPFKVNSYVINELIDWNNIPDDPVYTLTFPRKEMLIPQHYNLIAGLLKNNADGDTLNKQVLKIRKKLNPNPAGQLDYNVPYLGKKKLYGLQHKYEESILLFPRQGQTCHSYCTFCFRWPQFIGMKDLRFATNKAEEMKKYLTLHPEITDVIFTGGDPLTMKAKYLELYVNKILGSETKHITNIRIGTKTPSYYPFRFLTDPDADDLLRVLESIVKAGKHLAIMLHINHYREMETQPFIDAIKRLQNIGAVIRTQSPILRGINDSPDVWIKLWNKQVNLGLVPYYAFITRDTGAQHYFGVPLVEAWHIFKDAYQNVSGLCRTVRGPSMSCIPGKVQVLGVSECNGEKVIVMRMLQGRNPDWVHRPFFAEYNENAMWINDLKPAFNEDKFFFEEELEQIFKQKINEQYSNSFE